MVTKTFNNVSQILFMAQAANFVCQKKETLMITKINVSRKKINSQNRLFSE